MAELAANGAQSTLATPPSGTTGTSLAIQSADTGKFPSSGNFACLLQDSLSAPTQFEIVEVTGVSGATFTVTRASESYAGSQTAQTWSTGDYITQVATVGTIGRFAGPFVNVKDYGLAVDGVTDDTAGWNSLFSDYPSGATIYLPPGISVISSLVSVSGSNYLLMGAGNEYGPSIIQQTTANTGALSFTATSASRLVTSLVRGLQILGPGGTSSTSGAGIECACDVHLENVGISGFYYGLEWQGTTYYSRAYGCLFTNCQYGVYLDGTNNSTIDTCRITGAFSGYAAPIGAVAYGIFGTFASPTGLGVRVVNSSIEYFTKDGITFDGGRALTIQGCYFETEQSSAGYSHVRLGPTQQTSGVAIEGCHLEGDISGFHAVAGDYADHVTIQANERGLNTAISYTSTANSSDWLVVNDINSPAAADTLPATSYTLNPASPPPALGAPQNVNTVASSGTAQTLADPATATMNHITLTAACSLSFPSLTAGAEIWLELTQDATGGRTVTWPAGVAWPGGTAPTLSTAASVSDVFRFVCIDGQTWDASTVGLDYTSAAASPFFGTPVEVAIVAATSVAFNMTGTTSGQPILVFLDEISSGSYPSGISDTFATPYTWTMVQELQWDAHHSCILYIGTGGAGTSGTITATFPSGSYPGGIAVPCLTASSAAGAAAVDASNYSSGTTTTSPSPSLTPTAASEGAAYFIQAGQPISASPGSPWQDTALTYTGSQYGGAALYSNPPSGAALSTSWTQGSGGFYVVLAAIIKGA